MKNDKYSKINFDLDFATDVDVASATDAVFGCKFCKFWETIAFALSVMKYSDESFGSCVCTYNDFPNFSKSTSKNCIGCGCDTRIGCKIQVTLQPLNRINNLVARCQKLKKSRIRLHIIFTFFVSNIFRLARTSLAEKKFLTKKS